jgi:hypothetical protein
MSSACAPSFGYAIEVSNAHPCEHVPTFPDSIGRARISIEMLLSRP